VAGLHLLYVLWSNRLVRGCPYEVSVTAQPSASSQVMCSGDGLREGVVPQQFCVNVDTRRAAPGCTCSIYTPMSRGCDFVARFCGCATSSRDKVAARDCQVARCDFVA